MDNDWVTLGEAAKILGVAQSTVRKWADQGQLETFRTPGGHRRFRRGDLDNLTNTSSDVPRGKNGGAPEALIVDDDAGVREMIAEALTVAGWKHRQARNAVEAVQRLNESIPDLLLLDVQMPGTDGFTLMKRIREKLDAVDLPIVIYSGALPDEQVRGGASGGAQGYMAKPMDPYRLVAQANQLLG